MGAQFHGMYGHAVVERSCWGLRIAALATKTEANDKQR